MAIKPKVEKDKLDLYRGSGKLGSEIDYLQSIDPTTYYYKKFKSTNNKYVRDDMWTEASIRGESNIMTNILLGLEKAASTGKVDSSLLDRYEQYENQGFGDYDTYILALSVPTLDDTVKDEKYGNMTQKGWAEAVLNATFQRYDAEIVEQNKADMNWWNRMWSEIGTHTGGGLLNVSSGIMNWINDMYNIGEGLFNIFANWSGDSSVGDRFLWAFANDESDPTFAKLASDAAQEFSYRLAYENSVTVNAVEAYEHGYIPPTWGEMWGTGWRTSGDKVYNGWGTMWNGVTTSIGYMLPSIITANVARLTGASATTVKTLGSASMYAGITSGNISDTIDRASKLETPLSYKDLNAGSVISNAIVKASAQWAIEVLLGKILGFFSISDELRGLGADSVKTASEIGSNEFTAFLRATGRGLAGAAKEGLEEALQDLSDSIIDTFYGLAGGELNEVYATRGIETMDISNLLQSFVAGALTEGIVGSIYNLQYLGGKNRFFGEKGDGKAYKMGMFKSMNFAKALEAINDWNDRLNNAELTKEERAEAAYKISTLMQTVGSVLKTFGQSNAMKANNLLLSETNEIAKREAVLKLSDTEYADNLYKSFVKSYSDVIKKYETQKKEKAAEKEDGLFAKIKRALRKNTKELKESKTTEVKNIIVEELDSNNPDLDLPKDSIDNLKSRLKALGAVALIGVDGAIIHKSDDIVFVNNKILEKGELDKILQGIAYQQVRDTVKSKLTQNLKNKVLTAYRKVVGKDGTINEAIDALLFDKMFYTKVLLLTEEKTKANKDEAIEILATINQVAKASSQKELNNGNLTAAAYNTLMKKVQETMRTGLIVYATNYARLDLGRIDNSILPADIKTDIENHRNVVFSNKMDKGVSGKILDSQDIIDFDNYVQKFNTEFSANDIATLKQKVRSTNANDRRDAYMTLILVSKKDNYKTDTNKTVYLPLSSDGIVEQEHLKTVKDFAGISVSKLITGDYSANDLSDNVKNMICPGYTNLTNEQIKANRRYNLDDKDARVRFGREVLFLISGKTLTVGADGSLLRVMDKEEFLKEEYLGKEGSTKFKQDLQKKKITKIQDVSRVSLPKNLGDVPIIYDTKLGSINGTFDEKNNRILANFNMDTTSLAHEITHATQLFSKKGTDSVLGGKATLFDTLPADVRQDIIKYISTNFSSAYNILSKSAVTKGDKSVALSESDIIYFVLEGELQAFSTTGNAMIDLGFKWKNNKKTLVSPDGTKEWSMTPKQSKMLEASKAEFKQIVKDQSAAINPKTDLEYDDEEEGVYKAKKKSTKTAEGRMSLFDKSEDKGLVDLAKSIVKTLNLNEKNVGIHHGDFSKGIIKSEKTTSWTSGRSTGTFGTGTYLSSIDGKLSSNDKRKQYLIKNLDTYNLLKVDSLDTGNKLHKSLKIFNNYLLYNGLDKEVSQQEFDKAIIELANIFSTTTKALYELAFKLARKNYRLLGDKVGTIESPATLLVKSFNYGGIDTRNIPELDNDRYGTVVYDLKKSDIINLNDYKNYSEDKNLGPSDTQMTFDDLNVEEKVENAEDLKREADRKMFRERYVNNERAAKSNLKFWIKPGKSIFVHTGVRDFVEATTNDFDKLPSILQTKIKKGKLTINDIKHYVKTARNIDEFTFKAIAKFAFKNEELAKLTPDDMYKLQRNITDLAIAYYLSKDTITIMSPDEMLAEYKKLVNEASDKEVEKASKKAETVKVKNGSSTDYISGIFPDEKQMNILFFENYKGNLASLRRINNLGKTIAFKQLPLELKEDVNTGELVGGSAGAWNWVDRAYMAETDYDYGTVEELDLESADMQDTLDNIDRVVKIEQVAEYYQEILLDKVKKLTANMSKEEAKRWYALNYKKVLATLAEKQDRLHDISEDELNKKYINALKYFTETGKEIKGSSVFLKTTTTNKSEEGLKRSTLANISANKNKITEFLVNNENLYNILPDNVKSYFTPENKYVLDTKKYSSLPNTDLKQLQTNLQEARKILNKKINEKENALKTNKVLTDKVTKLEARIEKKDAQIENKDKQIEQLKAELKEAKEEKRNLRERLNSPSKYRIRVVNQDFNFTNNTQHTDLVLKLLNTTFVDTKMSKVKGVVSNREEIVANGKTFFAQNRDALLSADLAEIERTVDWFLNAKMNEATDLDYKVWVAIKGYFLTWVLGKTKEGEIYANMNSNLKQKLDDQIKTIGTVSGTLLAILNNMKDAINPTAAMASEDIELDGIKIDGDLKTKLFDAIDSGDVKKMRDAQQKIIEFVESKRTAKKSFWRKTVTLRSMSMLSSPLTWLRNSISNMILKPLHKFTDKIGGAVFKGHTYEGQLKLKANVTKDIQDYITTHFIDNKFFDTFVTNLSKYNPSDIKEQQKTKTGLPTKEAIYANLVLKSMYNQYYNDNMFDKNKKVGKAMNAVYHTLMKLMSDDKYVREAAIRYFGKILAEHKTDIKGGLVTDSVMNDLSMAIGLAMHDYMHSNNMFNTIEKAILDDYGEKAWFAYKLIMPFASSSWNWFKAMMKMTPVGLVKSIIDFARLETKVREAETKWEAGKSQISPELTEYMIRRNLGAGVVGTVGFIVGTMLAGLGYISLEDDDYGTPKIRVAGHVVDVSSIFGSSSILAGAAFMSGVQEAGGWSAAGVKNALNNVFDLWLDDMPVMEIVEMDMYADGGFSMGLSNLQSIVLSYIPNFLSYFAGIHKGTIKKDTFWKRAVAKLPGFTYFLDRNIDPYTGSEGSWKEAINRIVPFFSYDTASQNEKKSRQLGLNKRELNGTYKINGQDFNVTGKDLQEINKAYGTWNAEDLTNFYNNNMRVKVKVGDNNYKMLTYNQMDDKQRKSAVQTIMSNNAELAKIMAWTKAGNKYYGSATTYTTLRKRGITTNVYKGTKGFVKSK